MATALGCPGKHYWDGGVAYYFSLPQRAFRNNTTMRVQHLRAWLQEQGTRSNRLGVHCKLNSVTSCWFEYV